MAKILIWKKTAKGCEYDIFNQTIYDKLFDHVQADWGGVCKNWGNRLWFQGIYSALDNGENEYEFINDDMTIDYINCSFEKIILPMANIFYHGFRNSIRELTEIFEKISVPTYVVVCGVQADGYDSLNEVIATIGEDSRKFIRAIYNTGGEFALRGYFTKEFFDRLGFSSAVVTGCPSMYQLGSSFLVNDNKVELNDIRPIFNGHLRPYERLMQTYKSSVFIDQDEFFMPLFSQHYLDNIDMKIQVEFIKKYGMTAAQMISEGRIIVAADMNDWSNFIRQGNFNYAFGARIHGTIMALLSGIPATLVTTDSRTKEMAEFFNIPYVEKKAKYVFEKKEVERIYREMDYSKFNKTFRDKFGRYEKFLKEHGIISHINEDNKFFYHKEPDVFNGSAEQKEKYKNLDMYLQKNKINIKLASVLYDVSRRNKK